MEAFGRVLRVPHAAWLFFASLLGRLPYGVEGLALVLLVLLHSGRGGGLSDMFGGGMGAASSGSTVVFTCARPDPRTVSGSPSGVHAARSATSVAANTIADTISASWFETNISSAAARTASGSVSEAPSGSVSERSSRGAAAGIGGFDAVEHGAGGLRGGSRRRDRFP